MVKQRLKLASVSPMLIAAYRQDEMNLDQLSAFTVTDDHAKQEQVWAECGEGYSREELVGALTDDRIPASDPAARLVGSEALAGFVVQRVQDVSYKAFHIRQIRQMKVVGSNFPVAHKLAAALVSEDGASEATAAKASDAAAIAARPTHVVIAPVTVRATADTAGAAVTDLTPGTQVTGAAWTKIAFGGGEYLNCKIDDPSFAAPLYAILSQDAGSESYSLIWSRPADKLAGR